LGDYYQKLNEYVHKVQLKIGATAAASYIIQGDCVVNEWYSGRHAATENSRAVDKYTQFNVGSVRKTYLGLAISLLIEEGLIKSIDHDIGYYLNEYKYSAAGVTLRYLLTHTHGLIEQAGEIAREFKPGENWAYRNVGIDMLTRLVTHLSGQTLSAFLQDRVFGVYGLNETGWRTEHREQLIYNYYDDIHTWVGPNNSDAGDQGNLFVSARDMAKWGYIHLRKGYMNGKQLIPAAVFERLTALQTPATVPAQQPRNGFIWWLQSETSLNQIGERLPGCTYQILGITGCACIVVPKYDAVIVRMLNQLSNPDDYNYLNDIRTFGNLACDLLLARAE